MNRVLSMFFSLIFLFALSGCIESRAGAQKKTVEDRDALYEFVNSNVYQITRKEFDSSMKITYLDVTNDGVDDAVIVNDMDWSQNIFAVSVQEDKFKLIKTDIKVAKYSNSFEIKDGFLAVMQETGGTGVMVRYLTLAVYSNEKMITVLDNLKISSRETFQNVTYEDTAEIKGTYTNFEYTLKRTQGNKTIETQHAFYRYDKDNLKFEISK